LIERWGQQQPAPVISTDDDGTVTIPAAAYTVKARNMAVEPNAEEGQQILHNGGGVLEHYNYSIFEYEFTAETASKVYITANFTTWHIDQDLLLTLNGDGLEQNVPVFYSYGYWKETQPLEINLIKGKNTLRFARTSSRPIVIKEFFLYNVMPVIPTPDPSIVPTPTPPPTPTSEYIVLPQRQTCASQGISLMEEEDCSIAADFFGYKYTGSRSRDFFGGCFCLVSGEWAGNCNYNTNLTASEPNDDARALCLRHEYSSGWLEIV